ncbi:MAG: efflux RND transporter periplasmic adaptor subunit [Acidobacteria bacterium]|nr:efflux RND transporter periplasmic adaptor subunit [Acidobacteriota bacterium]
MKIARVLLFFVLLAAAFWGGYVYKGRMKPGAAGRKILYWVDPMHPAYKSDKPGIAPDCGMKLEPVYADGNGPAGTEVQPVGKILYYRDPKQPDYHAEKPGLNPETGNELEAVYENSPESMPPGSIRVRPEKQQLIGVRYGTAELTSASKTIRAVGKVTYDETLIAHVHTRVEGWLDKVYADFTGQMIRKGQPLATIYSPDLLATQKELLLAAKAKELMKQSSLESVRVDSGSLLDAARQRLQLWDLSDAQIDQVLRTGEPIRNVTLYSPVTGFITDRKAFANQKVMPEMDLYTVADLSRVWIMADVFESEAALVRVGQPARITLSYAPGKVLNARVNYIQPEVDPVTRTLKVRLETENPGYSLKPDMFVDVEFRFGLPRALTVPSDAVLDTGEKQTVFVDRGNGYLEPRRVEIGERTGDRVVILNGLKPGERIVTSGTFLIDSESQLKAAAEGMAGGH